MLADTGSDDDMLDDRIVNARSFYVGDALYDAGTPPVVVTFDALSEDAFCQCDPKVFEPVLAVCMDHIAEER
jgi:hypothetical protein